MKVMPLTHDFKEPIRARAQKDAKFRQALLREAVESYLNGDKASILSFRLGAKKVFAELEKMEQND